jgi:histidine ammonia-lyase
VIGQTDVVAIGDQAVTPEAIAAIAAGARVELAPGARHRIAASRAVVDALVQGDALIYGLNTGLGHLRNERVPIELLRGYQRAVVLGHAGAFGTPLPTEIVRATMAVRLAGFATGGAGVSPAAPEALAALLNARVHPIVPRTGSVGASDLMHLAAVAQVLIGEGWAEYRGQRVTGAEALRRAGLAPIELEPKDALAIISANAVSVGHASLVTLRAERLAAAADLVLAIALEAIGANPSILDPVVLAAKPVAGQLESGRRVAAHLAGSTRVAPGEATSVQDPLSFRVGPQVHGGLLEMIALLRRQVETELNASDDNPFVAADEGRMISNGNFHPFAMALAVDALRPAIAHVGQISDRRMNHLFGLLTSNPAVFNDPDALEGRAYVGLRMRYSAASRAAELRTLAGPVSLDVAPLDLGVEDHATNATVAVAATDEAISTLEDVLTVELLIGLGALAVGPERGTPGAGSRAALAELEAVVEAVPPGESTATIHAAVRAALPGIVAAAEAAAGT